MHADRSYILAVKAKKAYRLNHILVLIQPTRSLRSAVINGEEMILVAESHQTGQGKDTMEHYKALKDFGETRFSI